MTIISALPFTLQNGTTADATQVMADFDGVVDDVNNNAAHNGVNADITALTALTTPITPAQGGTSVYIGGTSGGAANVQTLANPSPNGFALAAGNRVSFIAGFTNTSAATLNVNSLGATNVFRQTPAGPVALTGGEIIAGNTVEVEFDGTQFVLFNSAAEVGGVGPLTSLASATTTDLGTIPSHNVLITGTTTITAFGSTAIASYPLYQIKFSGILLLTYNATSLILPGALSITTAVGDAAVALYLGSGNWQVISYTRANGTPLQFNAAFLQGYINGLTLSAAGGTGTFGIAAGITADSTNASMMALNSAYTKTTASWAVGTGNGGLDTGAIATSTWYHVFEIQRPDTGVVDILFSLSATAPTMPTNYTLFRRIGSMKTDGSSQWIKFTQTGDDFLWDVPVTDQSAVVLGASTLYTLASVPTGVIVKAYFSSFFTSTSASAVATLSSPLITAPAVATPTGNVDYAVQAANASSIFVGEVYTNTSAQIRAVSNGSGTISWAVATRGWRDRRGKS